MKNLLLAFIFCCIHIAAVAQTKIEKQLQGTWKMTEMNVGGVYANAVTQEITLSKELESQLTPEKRAVFNNNKQAVLDNISASRVVFTGNIISYTITGSDNKGTYTVKPQTDGYILEITDGNGGKDSLAIAIKEGKLWILKIDDVNQAELIFTKVVVK